MALSSGISTATQASGIVAVAMGVAHSVLPFAPLNDTEGISAASAPRTSFGHVWKLG